MFKIALKAGSLLLVCFNTRTDFSYCHSRLWAGPGGSYVCTRAYVSVAPGGGGDLVSKAVMLERKVESV